MENSTPQQNTWPASNFDAIRDESISRGGFFEELPNHCVCLIPGGKTLAVTFDSVRWLRQGGEREPWAKEVIESRGWSHLSVMSKKEDWFRHTTLLDLFDNLRDEGFFETYTRVLFYGFSMGSYGALSYCGAAPGATVLCYGPRTTHDDSDDASIRPETDGSGRYENVAAEVQSANTVYVLYDPLDPKESRHAAAIKGNNVTLLECWGLGHHVAIHLNHMDILKPVLLKAVNRKLTKAVFYDLYRRRFTSGRYLYVLFNRAVRGGHYKAAMFLLDQMRERNGNTWMRELIALHKRGLERSVASGIRYEPFD